MALSSSLFSERSSSSRPSIRGTHFHNHRRAPVTPRIDARLEELSGTDGLIGRGLELLETAGPALEAAIQLLEDPYLPEVTCNVLRLSKVEQGKPVGAPCPVGPRGQRKGIGLRYAIKPLRAAVWVRINPLLATALGLSVVGSLIGIGVIIGKAKT